MFKLVYYFDLCVQCGYKVEPALEKRKWKLIIYREPSKLRNRKTHYFFFQSESKNTPLNQQVIKWCSKIISVLPA